MTPDVVLHPDAERAFNARAEALIASLAPEPSAVRRPRPASFKPDIRTVRTIRQQDIVGELKWNWVDNGRAANARYCMFDNGTLGLCGDGFRALAKLAEQVQAVTALRPILSVEYVLETLFDWLVDKKRGRAGEPAMAYLLTKSRKDVREHETWFPVAMLHMQGNLQLGRILFRTVDRSVLERWASDWLARASGRPEAEQANVRTMLDDLGKNLQGLAAATITLRAEPMRALEVGLKEAEVAIALLRFFSHGALEPNIASYCAVLGKEHLQSITYLSVEEGLLRSVMHTAVDNAPLPWDVDRNQLERMQPAIGRMNALLGAPKQSQFQEDLLAALLLYSRATLMTEPIDKLVYVLTALEAMLLRNESEPIQQNLAERLAFVVGRTISERKTIVALSRRVYTLRSAFLHHAQRLDDTVALRQFMFHAWCYLATMGSSRVCVDSLMG